MYDVIIDNCIIRYNNQSHTLGVANIVIEQGAHSINITNNIIKGLSDTLVAEIRDNVANYVFANNNIYGCENKEIVNSSPDTGIINNYGV